MSESDLAFIQRCVREGRLLWTYHVNMRLRQRRVARPMVTESMDSYQIIEQYPQSQASRYLPSCLVYASITESRFISYSPSIEKAIMHESSLFTGPIPRNGKRIFYGGKSHEM